MKPHQPAEEAGLDPGNPVLVRKLKPEDLGRVVALDAKIMGRERRQFYEGVLERNLRESGIQISLAAEIEGLFVGFLLARAWYGEFGSMEPQAVLESLGVHPDFRGRGVGRSLMEQLAINLRGLRLSTVRTEVGWNDLRMLAFLHRLGFSPAQRLVLERAVDAADSVPPDPSR